MKKAAILVLSISLVIVMAALASASTISVGIEKQMQVLTITAQGAPATVVATTTADKTIDQIGAMVSTGVFPEAQTLMQPLFITQSPTGITEMAITARLSPLLVRDRTRTTSSLFRKEVCVLAGREIVLGLIADQSLIGTCKLEDKVLAAGLVVAREALEVARSGSISWGTTASQASVVPTKVGSPSEVMIVAYCQFEQLKIA